MTSSLPPSLDALASAKRFWLLKTEPGECSIESTLAMPSRTVSWFGVRNYQARSFIRDSMAPGDAVLFYHSSCKVPGIAGLARVASAPYPDALQFDPKSAYYDPKSAPGRPRWFAVDVEALAACPVVPIGTLRSHPALSGLRILQKGNRLSVTPVERADFLYILERLILPALQLSTNL